VVTETTTLDRGVGMRANAATSPCDPDEPLVARFLAGDARAFDMLFARHQDYVYNIVYGILGRHDEARDVTQEVFLQVHRSIRSFRRGSRFATWLYRIAVNRAVDAGRRRTRMRWLPLHETLADKPDEAPGPEDAAIRTTEVEAVQRVLNEVPLQHRDVLVLRYYQGLSVEEIAEVLGVSATAAKVRLHRARRHFKERYVALYGDQSEAD
jgi:RNA polymerase sigma-70 factor (ECF subfamily)